MKTKIDIFTGFLGSGKTSIINGMLEKVCQDGERIVIIQCEWGEEELHKGALEKGSIFVKKPGKEEPVDAKYIETVLKKYLPHRIIIEQNGMSGLMELLGALDEGSIAKKCRINNVVNVIDCRNFEMLMNLVGSNLVEQIENSDLLVLNHALDSDGTDNLKKTLKALNRSAEIISIAAPEDFGKAVEDGALNDREEGGWIKKPSDKLFAVFLAAVLLYLLVNVFRSIDFDLSKVDISGLQVLNTVFISILIQAFPFLLIGVFVSSIIQIFVSKEMIIKYFPRNKFVSFLAAVLGGLLFPVCDCAIVPVATRLVKKGVPLHAAVTFMLAAPIVNPIVIASTMYAFPGQPQIAFYRVYLGITVAVATGITFMLFPEKEEVVLKGPANLLCNCIYCSTGNRAEGFAAKAAAVFKHAGEEFFDVGRFLVAGAALTSIFQVAVPKTWLEQTGSQGVVSLLVMLAAAVILSVCSSSDAFIARSFSNQFPMGSVMGFMVLGPMVDVKNVLMLFSSFNKRFIIKFLLIVCVLSFSLLYFFAEILF